MTHGVRNPELATAELDSIWLPLEGTETDTAVSVILKLRGETCDIDCLYCFEKRKEAPGGRAITPEQVRYLGQIFGARPLAVELHGGEPLTIARPAMAALLDELAAQPTVLRVQMQTNGLRLDEQWLDLFNERYPKLTLGISLDGDAAGNTWRVGYDGRPVYPRIAAALDLLAAHDRTCGIVTAVTPALLGRAAETIDHIASFTAVRAINLVPVFDDTITHATGAVSGRVPQSRRLQQVAVTPSGPAWAVTPNQYADFVLAATARWIAAGHFRRIKLDPAVATIRRLRGLDSSHCHFSNLKCSHVFTVYPDGRMGSCDELPWPAARLLSLTAATSEADLTHAQRNSGLLVSGRELMAKCVTCSYRSLCGGGCTATRQRMHRATGNDDIYCDHRTRLIDGMAALLAAPRHPAGAQCRRAHWTPRIPIEIHDPGQPCRHESYEPRIHPLIDTLTASWQATTYGSCEGHPRSGTEQAPSIFRVGLLPRDQAEYAALSIRACRTLALVETRLPATVAVRLARTELRDPPSGQPHPALEIALIPAPSVSWDAYFADLDQSARVLHHAARHTAAASHCTCTTPRPAAVTPTET